MPILSNMLTVSQASISHNSSNLGNVWSTLVKCNFMSMQNSAKVLSVESNESEKDASFHRSRMMFVQGRTIDGEERGSMLSDRVMFIFMVQ